MSDLPQFAPRKLEAVEALMSRAFINERIAPTTTLKKVIAYDDGHYRALFTRAYFALADGENEPSKSQWNTLKKHLKRIEPRLFIFKEHGTAEYDGQTCLYIDFGFFAH